MYLNKKGELKVKWDGGMMAVGLLIPVGLIVWIGYVLIIVRP